MTPKQQSNIFIEGLRAATAPKAFHASADGFGPYVSSMDSTLSDRADFAQLIKVHRATPEGERRYSPAEVVSTEVVRWSQSSAIPIPRGFARPMSRGRT